MATAVLEAVYPIERLTPDLFGDFSPGRFGWVLTDIVKIEEPIPWKGRQGFFEVEIPVKWVGPDSPRDYLDRTGSDA